MSRPTLCLFLVCLLFPVAPVFAAEPAPPPRDKEEAKRVEALIDKLTEVTNPDLGYSPTVTGTIFLPLDREGELGPFLLAGPGKGQPLQRSEVMLELEKLGAAAVPYLIAHLNDKRPTKIPNLVHAGLIGGIRFHNTCDVNPRTQKPVALPKDLKPDDQEPGHTQITVGDLCFVALGQIVNRRYIAVRYQPTAIVVVTSPARSELLRTTLVRQWSDLTPEKHKASLIDDLLKADSDSRCVGAAKRLAFYYPDAIETPVLKLLARPSYDAAKVDTFLVETLYAARDAPTRKKLFDDFLAANGAVYRDGILLALFDDLASGAAAGTARTCLVELYRLEKTVTANDRPGEINALSTAAKVNLISGGLIFDRSPKIDRAVRDLLVSVKDDDRVVVACMDRLVGRGYDADLERYCKGRPETETIKRVLSRVGWTPVHVAIGRGRTDELADLLRNGVNPGTAAKNGQTPLHMAATIGDLAVAKLLLDAKAPPDAKANDGQTAVLLALEGYHLDLVQLLVDRGATVPNIFVAAIAGKPDIAKALVKGDPACVGSKTKLGQTALHLAAMRGHATVADVLLKEKAVADAIDEDGTTPLHFACYHGHDSVVRVLIAHKADVRKKVYDGGPEPLHLAASEGKVKVLELLLDNKVDVNAKQTPAGATALHYTALYDQREAAELLLKRGATVDEPEARGRTPLHLAVESGHIKIVELLLANKAKVNAQTKDEKNTPLHLAVAAGSRELVVLLLRHNANLTIKDAEGQTPSDVAESAENKEIIKLLRDAMKK